MGRDYPIPFESSECNKISTASCERTDIKTETQNRIIHFEEQIRFLTEQLRKEKEKLRLITRNKDLEAYINLTR